MFASEKNSSTDNLKYFFNNLFWTVLCLDFTFFIVMVSNTYIFLKGRQPRNMPGFRTRHLGSKRHVGGRQIFQKVKNSYTVFIANVYS